MKKVKNDSQPFISYIIPMFILPFKLKDGEQFDFGLMLDDNEAKEILKEIKEFLNINKLT